MDRILILGCPGAGKSTLARELGEILDLPVIHLDREYWNPGWVETPSGEWETRMADLVRREKWIMDGNYGSTLAMRLARADGVVFLDYPRWLCMVRVIRRIMGKKHRPDMTPGCSEYWDREFLRFVWGFKRKGRLRNYSMLEETGQLDKTVVLRRPGETRRYLRGMR